MSALVQFFFSLNQSVTPPSPPPDPFVWGSESYLMGDEDVLMGDE